MASLASFEMIITPQQIQEALATFIDPSYPNMEIRVEPWADDPSRLAVHFLEPKFALLYPQQRWHYLHHLIPAEFQDRYLSSSVWFELAPGESPCDLVYSDEAAVADITEPIMTFLNKTSFFATLDEAFTRAENPAVCYGDFRVVKSILPTIEREPFSYPFKLTLRQIEQDELTYRSTNLNYEHSELGVSDDWHCVLAALEGVLPKWLSSQTPQTLKQQIAEYGEDALLDP